ncbi:cation:proton antiporter [Novosphingopyxis baekryungensis]|uniref:cation:proton antiporter n=1 Tax=Novosphingopyxis baekryungensis TaxID=279369 RepID=UPI00048FCFC3|nr:sodium:proton antiporter [Novosphingopyxis baekryungensis]
MIPLDSLMVKIALIGVLGIGAQWVAWRTNLPAIALMLVAGLIAGPALGLIEPERDFGTLLEPIVKLAVAVILFEGGLSLNFRELRYAGWGVARLVIIGVPVGWVLGTAAVHYGAGLPLSVAALFGGILVVTGPTVIGPMLRTLRVPNRVRDILKWEGIVNDPIGALLAVAIYAFISYRGDSVDYAGIGFEVIGATFVAGLIGAALGYALTYMFPRGLVPEYLKAPLLLITVIFGFVIADIIMHETGLITVTVMGVVMANKPVHSSRALHRFKEDLAVLLISGVFILLSATLDWETMQAFQARFVVFLLLLLFVVRPVTVLVSLFLSGIPWREQLFIAWIAPRGIVAIAVTGLFALRLVDLGYDGADALVPLVFSVVIATIVAHGFSASWVAKRLGIDQGKGEAILMVGASRWTIDLSKFLKGLGYRVVVSDTSKFALRSARRQELEIHQGEILDEAHGHELDMAQFQHLIVATENDSYNQLVGTDLGPEIGYDQITLVSADEGTHNRISRGRVLMENGPTFETLQDRQRDGWIFSKTQITEKFTFEKFVENLDAGEEPVAVMKPDKRLLFFSTSARPTIEEDDIIISFVAPDTPEELKAQKMEERARKEGAREKSAGREAAKGRESGGPIPDPA